VKRQRTEHFWLYTYGWKIRKCTACAGSGRYDSTGSPPCWACKGTGKEYYPGPKALWVQDQINAGASIEDIIRLSRHGINYKE